MKAVKRLCILAQILLITGLGNTKVVPTIEELQRILTELEELGLNPDESTTFEAVYRLDLLPTFAAYFMVNHVGGQYVMISSGPGTGDYDVALQGDESQGMSPTMRMKQDNRDCDKSYLVLPASDSFICKDSSGTIVSNTLSQPFLNDAGGDMDAYFSNETVIADLKKQWEDHATEVKAQESVDQAEIKSGDEEYTLKLENPDPSAKASGGFTIKPIQPGDSKNVATGPKVTKVTIVYRRVAKENDADANKKLENLCEAIENCKMANGEATITPKFVVKVAGDKRKKKVVITLKEDANTILDGKEVVFSVIIYKKAMKINSVMFQVNYPAESKGYQYTGWYGYYYKWVPYSNLVPYYVIHKINNCYAGSVAASWAVIFGYFDRRTHYADWGYGSMELYRSGWDGTFGSWSQIAPSSNTHRLDWYMRHLAEYMDTHCSGYTFHLKIFFVGNFYEIRQYHVPIMAACSTTACTDFMFDTIGLGWPVLIFNNNVGSVAIARREAVRYRRDCLISNWFCGNWYVYQRIRHVYIHTAKVNHWTRYWVGNKAFFAITARHS